MLSRLAIPLGFLIGLAALGFVMQTLGNSSADTTISAAPDILKQFAIVEIAPPATTVTDRDNKKIDLVSLLTKPTLVTFWSVGCGECETGLPILDKFAKSQSTIAIILVDTKDDPADAEDKLKTLNVATTTFYDRDGLAFQNWEATMPASYFVAGGKLKYFFPGRVSNEHLQALLTVR